jgi:hypothetical protein
MTTTSSQAREAAAANSETSKRKRKKEKKKGKEIPFLYLFLLEWSAKRREKIVSILMMMSIHSQRVYSAHVEHLDQAD